jgi:hypothetical protein
VSGSLFAGVPNPSEPHNEQNLHQDQVAEAEFALEAVLLAGLIPGLIH